MNNKAILVCLVSLAIGIQGCGQAQSANHSTPADKGQPVQAIDHKKDSPIFTDKKIGTVTAEKAPTQKATLPQPEGNNKSITYRTPDTPAYHWPAEFKLPLDIHIKFPEVPEEIQKPSPPIKEETKLDLDVVKGTDPFLPTQKIEEMKPIKEETGSATHE